MGKKYFFWIMSMMMFCCQYAYGNIGGKSYIVSSSVESVIELRTNLPTSVSFSTAINEGNRSESETTTSSDMNAYTNTEGLGIKFVLGVSGNHADKQHPTGSDQLYLIHTGDIAGQPDSNVRIPYKVQYRPCYLETTTEPAYMDLHPDPTGTENDVPLANSFEDDCLPPNGTFGAIRFVRESMTNLPLAGTYQGTVNIDISPQ